jgi:ATP-binding cassette subfamily B protein
MSDEQARLAGASTGWRALWRGFRTLMVLGLEASPPLFVYVFAVETANSVLGLLSTYTIKFVVDAAVAADPRGVLLAAGAVTATRAAQLWCGHQYVNATTAVQERLGLLIDQKVLAITGGAPGLEHEERPDYADQVALINRDRWLIGGLANSILLNLRNVLQVGGSALILGQLHPLLALLPLFGLPLFLASKRANELRERLKERLAEQDRMARHLFERATAIDAGKELRVFGLAGELIRRHRALAEDALRQGRRVEWQGAALNVAGDVCFAAGYVAALALVLWRAVNGLVSVGEVVLATMLAAQLNWHVAAAVRMATYFLGALRATSRYLWLVEYEHETRSRWASPAPAPVPARLVEGITLDAVSFRYPGTEQEILRGVSAHLPAGAVVAFVGENGAGKSTLVKLLTRFYEPNAGRVLVDGVDVRRFDLHEWQARSSAAFQDFCRFEFVLRETVGVGDLPAASDAARVRGALARAGGEDVPAALPLGLETQLGKTWEGGVALSGGQWQKLALARAFMREQPLLVVFDEPTAALDAPTEHALFERFAAAARSGASRGTVTLIVSHRFSTVRMADLIVVLDGGRVREAGGHEALMAAGGLYAELYELQARAYR